MKELTDLLTALKATLNEWHWLADGYSQHLQAERIAEGIDTLIDRCKEFYLGLDGESDIAFAKESLLHATSFIENETITTPRDRALTLIDRGISICEKFDMAEYPKRAAENLIGDISEHFVHLRYLIKFGGK